MGFDVEATVHVARMTQIDVPEYVSTSSGNSPFLPYEVPVHWSDGATSMQYINWDNVPGSAYTGERERQQRCTALSVENTES